MTHIATCKACGNQLLSTLDVLNAIHDHLTSTGALRIAHLVDFVITRVAHMEQELHLRETVG